LYRYATTRAIKAEATVKALREQLADAVRRCTLNQVDP
jgi:hypothetical protein